MKRIFESFFTGLLAALVLTATNAQAAGLTVAIFGDSLVSGVQMQPAQAFPTRLADKMRSVGYTDLNFVDMSQEDMTTALGVDRVAAVLERRPDVVIVAFGPDDVERGVLVAQTYNNLAAITGRLMQAGSYIILAGMKAPPDLPGAYANQFNNMYALVSKSRKTLLIPDILANVVGNPQLTLADGVHANDRGVDIMVENSYRYVDTCLRTRIQALQYQEEYKAYQQGVGHPVGR